MDWPRKWMAFTVLLILGRWAGYGLTSRWALRSGRSFSVNWNGPAGGADLGGSS